MAGTLEDRQIRGQVPIGVVSYLEKRLDPARRQNALNRLSAETRAQLGDLQRNRWYPASLTIELYRAVAELNESGKDRYDELLRAGRHLAEEATNTFLRLLVKFLTPTVFARKFPTFWSKDHNFGAVSSDTSQFDSNRLILNLGDVDGYDYIGPVCAGWIARAFESIGAKNVAIAETICNHERFDSATYRYELTWG